MLSQGLLRSLLVVILFSVAAHRANAQDWHLTGLENIVDMAQLDDTSFLAITTGGEIIRTSDRWATWTHSLIYPGYSFDVDDYNTNDFDELAFSGDNGFIIGFRNYYTSSDRGLTWTSHRYPTFERYSSLANLDDGSFVMVDSKGRLFSSRDMRQGTIIQDSILLQEVKSSFDGTLIGRTHWKQLIVSTDRGSTWQKITGTPDIENFVFTDRMNGAVFVVDGEVYALTTSDGGASWERMENPMGRYWALDSTTIRIGNVIFSTRDGVLDSLDSKLEQAWISEIKIGSVFYRSNLNKISRSLDTGKTWQVLVTLEHPYHSRAPRFRSAAELELLDDLGDDKQLYSSIDSGYSWSYDPSWTHDERRFVWMTDSFGYWINKDTLFLTRDGGASLEPLMVHTFFRSGAYIYAEPDLTRQHTLVYVLRPDSVLRVEGEQTTWLTGFTGQAGSAHILGDRILLTTFNEMSEPSYFISDDRGSSWTILQTAPITRLKLVGKKTIAVVDLNGWRVTTNNGQSWKNLWPSQNTELVFISEDSLILFESSVIRISTNGGGSWQLRSPPKGTTLRDLYVAHGHLFFDDTRYMIRISINSLFGPPAPVIQPPAQLRWVFTGGRSYALIDAPDGTWLKRDEGQDTLRRSRNAGDTWTRSDSSARQAAAPYYVADQDLFSANGFKSTDLGNHWKLMFGQGLRLGLTGAYGYVYAANGDLLVAHDQGISFSHDRGKTWPKDDSVLRGEDVYVLTREPGGDDLYAVTENGLRRSTDNGKTWPYFRERLMSEPPFSRFTFGPNGEMYLSATHELYRSTDKGATWYRIFYPNHQLSMIGRIAPVTDSIIFLIGRIEYDGPPIIYTTDQGDTWTSCDTAGKQIYDLKVMSNGYVAAASLEHGIIRTYDRLGQVKASVPEQRVWSFDVKALEVYPNPARNVVHVEAPAGSEVQIVDLKGSIVLQRTLSSDLSIDLNGLSAGAYFIRANGASAQLVIEK